MFIEVQECWNFQDHFKDHKDEFSREVELLAKIDHRNLVKLLGFVDEGDERLIITEYVPNGTLRAHLDGKTKRFMACSHLFPKSFF